MAVLSKPVNKMVIIKKVLLCQDLVQVKMRVSSS